MRKFLIIAAPALLLAGAVVYVFMPRDTVMAVYKTPGCGCCEIWMTYMEEEGFTIERIDVPAADKPAVPNHLRSCHTAYIGDYIVEGHIPAEDVRRLLDEQPDVAGLVLPGMPEGSPGMEGPNPVEYDVFTFKSNGETAFFAAHGP